MLGGLVLELICRAECSVSWNGGQIDRTPLDFCAARNDLNGPFELLVVKSCAKVRVPVDHGLERVGQLRLVQWPGEVEACSKCVDVCGSVTDRMEQEAFL